MRSDHRNAFDQTVNNTIEDDLGEYASKLADKVHDQMKELIDDIEREVNDILHIAESADTEDFEHLKEVYEQVKDALVDLAEKLY